MKLIFLILNFLQLYFVFVLFGFCNKKSHNIVFHISGISNEKEERETYICTCAIHILYLFHSYFVLVFLDFLFHIS